MRRIQKGHEPPSWAVRRSTPGAITWDAVHGNERQEARNRLFDEQAGLCAYCMTRLPGTGDADMKIEHWHARSARPDLVLDWDNVLGVCAGDVGGSGSKAQRFHCDAYRGALPQHDQALTVHPAAYPPDAATLFRFSRSTGEIGPAPALDAAQADNVQLTVDRLNLNIDRLRRNRLAVIQKLRGWFRAGRMNPAKLADLLGANRTPHEGRLPEYCEVAAQYLEGKKRENGW